MAGESAPGSVQGNDSEYEQEKESSLGPSGRPRRAAAANHASGLNGMGRRRDASADTDEDNASEAGFGDDEHDADAQISQESEDEEEFEEDEVDPEEKPRSLVVKLSVTRPRLQTVLAPLSRADNTSPKLEDQSWKGNASRAATAMMGTPEAPSRDSISVSDGAAGGAIVPSPGGAGEPISNRSVPPDSADKTRGQSPSAAAATSLAFRGSPEKVSV